MSFMLVTLDIGELRDEPEFLAEHLLGAIHAGPGLLRRVSDHVRILSDDSGPHFRTGSVMMPSAPTEYETGDDKPRILELAVALIEWREGNGIGTATEAVERALKILLRREKLTDADYLLTRPGYLSRVRTTIREALRAEPPDVDRCLALAEYLQAWLGRACDHDWRPAPSEDPRIVVLECDCGARCSVRGDDLLAV